MKTKISITFITTALFLTACGEPLPTQQNSPDFTPEELSSRLDQCSTSQTDESTCYFDMSLEKQDFKICTYSSSDEVQNQCLVSYLEKMVYDENLPIERDLCVQFKNNEDLKNSCFELLAQKTKDSSLCNYAANKQACETKITYQNGGSYWNLKDHWTDTNDERLEFVGSAIIRGYFTKAPSPGNNQDLYFRILDQNLTDLPPVFYTTEYKLSLYDSNGLPAELTDEQLQKFPLHDAERPIEIEVNAVQLRKDMPAMLNLNQIPPR